MSRTVVVERSFPHPPGRIWRALTMPDLMAEWLMPSDFRPVVGHRFTMRGAWGGTLDCEVLQVEPERALSYTWNHVADDPALGLQSVVTLTLTPTPEGTRLRMEQAGFRDDQPRAFGGARIGWDRMLGALETLLDRIAEE